MKTRGFLVALVPLMGRLCRADLLQYADQVPKCGMTCLEEAVPVSTCGSFADATCVCSNEALYHTVQECVDSSCTVEESLEVLRISKEACGAPERPRTMDFWAITAVEAFTLTCLCLRIYARWRAMGKFEPEDYVMIVVLVLFPAFTAIGKYAALTAFGLNIWTLGSETISTAMKLIYIDETFHLTLLSLTKVAILCFYLRIFPNKGFRFAVWGMMSLVIVATTLFVILTIFQCSPISYNWDGWKGGADAIARCIDVNALSYVAAAFAIAQETLILVLPLPLLISLNTTWRKKIGIILMFSLGVFVLVTSCIRLRYLVTFTRSTNPTWDYTDMILWTAIEVNVSILVASLPAICQLLSHMPPRAGSGTTTATTVRSSRSSSQRVLLLGADIMPWRSRPMHSRRPGFFLSRGRTRRSPGDANRGCEYGHEHQHLENAHRARSSLRTEIVANPAQAVVRFDGTAGQGGEDHSGEGPHIRVLTTISSETHRSDTLSCIEGCSAAGKREYDYLP